jgi:hypothetical protein
MKLLLGSPVDGNDLRYGKKRLVLMLVILSALLNYSRSDLRKIIHNVDLLVSKGGHLCLQV